MWREIAAVLTPIVFPAIILAQVPGTPSMAGKIIQVYGTYLPSSEPMECGTVQSDPTATARVKTLFGKVSGWPNFRAMYPLADWVVDAGKCRVPTDAKDCYAMLEYAGVSFQPAGDVPGISDPVVLEPVINGVKLKYKNDLVMACDLALAVADMTQALSALDVKEVGVLSLYRPDSTYSFHSLGLGMDINYVRSSSWSTGVWVETAFEKNHKRKTCKYPTTTKRAGFLMDVACTLHEQRVFTTVITPNYNEAHHNHFHVDVRPGDNRFYLR